MLNLIRRDLILQKRQLIVFVPFILFFVLLGASPVIIFLVASVFIPFNAYAYDEKAETNILLNSLPYTRREIIASRYIGALVYMVLSVGLASLAMFIFDKPFALADMAFGTGMFLLFAALTFPMFQIFKPGYITTFLMIIFILSVWIVQWVINAGAERLSAVMDFFVNISAPALYSGAAVIVLAAYGISWAVSSAIYQRKAF